MSNLIFVYNADSGLFNTFADIGHKIFSPQTYRCDLCMLTHGVFSEREEWREFVQSLPISAHFLHRDEFRKAYPQVNVPLPAVFVEQDGEIRLCLGSRSLHECRNLEDLKQLITTACTRAE